MKLVTAALMRQIDREAIDKDGIPSLELMENAGKGIAERILSGLASGNTSAIAVVCGTGNNGGDGFVIARHLHTAGCTIRLFCAGPEEKLSDDARKNYLRAHEIGLRTTFLSNISQLAIDESTDLIVDAIFGTGFTGVPRGITSEVIERLNDTGIMIVSVDLPSGVNAGSGACEGAAINAEVTYTLALPKFGLYLSPGREQAGDVVTVPIGIKESTLTRFAIQTELTTFVEAGELLPYRKPDGHKGDFGKLLVIAGSTGLTGAASLVGTSALRSGCGLVKVGCPATVLPIIAAQVAELTTYPLPDVGKKGHLALRGLGEILELVKPHDAVALGPGLGQHHETSELVKRLVAKIDKPLVIDADGLNALKGTTECFAQRTAPTVLTPHPGEFERLTGEPASLDYQVRIQQVRKYASEWKVVLLLKGSPTLISDSSGSVWLNPTGNSGMATGGSGDVLTGMIGSLLAQGCSAIDAARCAAYLHGMAGDIAAEELTARAMIAGDIIDALPYAFELIEQ